MKKSYLPLKTAALASVIVLGSGLAQGQTSSSFSYPAMETGYPIQLDQSKDVLSLNARAGLSLQGHGDHQMWNTVFIVSIVVGVIGIVDSDTSLIVLGAAGAVLSSMEMNQHFRFNLANRGLDLMHTGPLSFGLNPLAGFADCPGVSFKLPAMYLKATFRF